LTKNEWWRHAAIYQIYPRSFQDSNADGLGDLRGALRRLPYVASLGVDAIWISPFFKSPMADMGYDISDFCDVDPCFGSLADFDALLVEAHNNGLKVLIDHVLAHTSDKHAWFIESRASRKNPRADWYVWAAPKADGTAPNNWLSVFGGSAWEWDGVRRQYYFHNFLAAQPALNFHNPEVQDAVLATARFWLDRGVDGFRLDAVNYCFHDAQLRDNPPFPLGATNDISPSNPYGFQDHLHDKTQPENLDFLRRYRQVLNEYGDCIAMGEVGDGPRSLKTAGTYTSGGDKLQMCYTFDLLSEQISPALFAAAIRDFQKSAPDGWPCWAFSNHDVVRHATRWGENLTELAIMLLVSLRGAVCLYQGEELGLTEAQLTFKDLRDPYGIRFWPAFKGRDGCRTPMVWEAAAPNAGFSTARPWLPVAREHLSKAVDTQPAILDRYREALNWRRQHPVLQYGSIEIVKVSDTVLAFRRTFASEAMLCEFNLAKGTWRFKLSASAPKARRRRKR
jgi:alpha-glucosidase